MNPMKTIRRIVVLILLVLVVCTSSMCAQDLTKSISHEGITVSYPDGYWVGTAPEMIMFESDSGYSKMEMMIVKGFVLSKMSEEEKMKLLKDFPFDYCSMVFGDKSKSDIRTGTPEIGKYGEYSCSLSYTGIKDGVAIKGEFISIIPYNHCVNIYYMQVADMPSETRNIQAIIRSIKEQ